MGSKEDKCYVVKTNCVAKKVNKSDCFTLRLGTLVYVEKVITNDLVAVRIDTSEKLISTSNEDYLWECPILNILPFDECMKPYILAVSSPLERVTLVQDEELCKTLSAFSVGSMVLVLPQKTLSSSKNQESSAIKEAIVKYKGPVHQMGVGTYFGIELLDPDPSDADTCDGTYSGCARYFSSPPGSGLFVAIHRLRPKPDSVAPRPPVIRSNKPVYHQPDASGDSPPFQICAVQKVRATFESMSQSSQLTSHTEKLIDLSPNRNHADVVDVPLKIGERVVWYRDSGQEHGVVRWLGHLEPSCIDLQAGIEFDNPVGKGTGLYNGKQLFEARKNHAFVLPVMALVKADDLYEHSSTSDLIKAKKKPSPISANLAGTDESCCMLSTMKTGRGMKPDQLYAPVKLKHPDCKWTCDIDGLDDHLCTNGSATSPVESKVFVNIDSTRKKGRKIENTPLESELNYGVNSTTTSHSNHAVGMKQMDKYSKGCDSVFVSSNIDISGRKCKINSKWAKVNNIDCDPSNLDGEWCGRSQQRPNRSKQDCEYKSVIGSNGKSVKVNNTIERSSHPNSSDIDLDILPSRSPSEHSVGGSDGYYDTPEPAHELQDLQNSPELPHVPYPDLGVGSVVEVFVKDEPLYGVIRWIGSVPEDKKARKLAGIEMEEERVGFSDGTFHGHRYFICNPRKALFVNLKECQKDGRFQEPPPSASADSKCKGFGQVDCPVIPGIVRPVAVSGDLQSKCGKFHGIQGHHNSCYLDATLFSMFTFTSVFDSLLYRPPTEKDCVQYEEVQQVLREEIVNPLRTNLFVRADRVMKLRTLLENHSSVSGLTSEEKDPEEFLNSLVAQILCADPFLKLSSGQEAYHYQLFVEKDEQLKLPSVQKLFEQSFLASDIKLKEVPSCLIIQMPRFGKSFKMYPRILPSQLLDVTDVIEDSPRQCTVCGKLAEFECKECMDHFDVGLENIAYCGPCLRTAHSHQRRAKHVWRQLKVPLEFEYIKDACSTLPRLYMELFAVVCIETSHYVAFVKCGSGSDAPWCFFDSMADRKGEQNGYNIPEMVPCPDLPYWLSDKGAQSLMDLDNRQLPEHAKRLLCDAYMCMYQSSDVMMYR